MTDRPAGQPDPDEGAIAPEDAGDAEALAGVDSQAPDADDARDLDEAVDEAVDGVVGDDVDQDDSLVSDAEAEAAEIDDYDAAVSEVSAANAGAGAVVPPVPAPIPGRRRAAAPTSPRVPTASEIAVHVREDVSKVYVILAVVVFVAIFLNGLVLGAGGLLASKATPSPSVSAGPSASASASPSASGSTGASPSGSAPTAASRPPSAAPSGSVAPSP
ncbi:MAG TPA: hypothetical protein VFI69_09590 [Candidatus Limnocylindrales bacterium]|nr:hypothetical protein [Candidatus Limnocylindrales bacterium]